MRILRIDGTESRADLVEAVKHLRLKKARCAVQQIRNEIDADVDELVDRIAALDAADGQ